MKKATLEEFRIYVDSLSDLSNYSGSDRLRAVRGVSKMRRALRLDAGEYRFFPGNEKSNCSVVMVWLCPEVNYAIRLKGYSLMYFSRTWLIRI